MESLSEISFLMELRYIFLKLLSCFWLDCLTMWHLISSCMFRAMSSSDSLKSEASMVEPRMMGLQTSVYRLQIMSILSLSIQSRTSTMILSSALGQCQEVSTPKSCLCWALMPCIQFLQAALFQFQCSSSICWVMSRVSLWRSQSLLLWRQTAMVETRSNSTSFSSAVISMNYRLLTFILPISSFNLSSSLEEYFTTDQQWFVLQWFRQLLSCRFCSFDSRAREEWISWKYRLRVYLLAWWRWAGSGQEQFLDVWRPERFGSIIALSLIRQINSCLSNQLSYHLFRFFPWSAGASLNSPNNLPALLVGQFNVLFLSYFAVTHSCFVTSLYPYPTGTTTFSKGTSCFSLARKKTKFLLYSIPPNRSPFELKSIWLSSSQSISKPVSYFVSRIAHSIFDQFSSMPPFGNPSRPVRVSFTIRQQF